MVESPGIKPDCKDDRMWLSRYLFFISPFFDASRRLCFVICGISWISSLISLRTHAYSNILKILPPTNYNFQIKILIFFIFCSTHRLWVLVRTASTRRFLRVPTIYVYSRNKNNNVYPCKLQFYYIKVGFKGVNII